MIRKFLLLKIATIFTLQAFCQNTNEKYSREFVEKKDTETVRMIHFYTSSELGQLSVLFPSFKKFTSILNSIKMYSKSKYFAMRPNFLISMQDEKTKIVLTMVNPKNKVISFLVSFTSKKIDSQIESIVRYTRFDDKPGKEEIIEINSKD